MKIYCNNKILSENCKLLTGFIPKLFGKIFLREDVLLKNTNGIHTFFMRNNIDVIFMDMNYNVLKIKKNLEPNKIIFPVSKVFYILELSENTLLKKNIDLDSKIEVVE